MKEIKAYKLFRLRKNGSLGSLFIARRDIIPCNKWVKARAVRTKGFYFRPGWHACSHPNAPHLSNKGRVWATVKLKGITKHQRPPSQGGLWYTAKYMKVTKLIKRKE